MTRPTAKRRLFRKRWLLVLLVAALLYAVLPQLKFFHESLRVFGRLTWRDIVLAEVCICLTYLAAAGTYCFLAVRRLRYGRTVLLQLASMFANRLLPAGIGGIGVNYLYLRKSKHSAPQAAGVVAANGLLGFIGHLLLVAGLLIGLHGRLSKLQPSRAGFHLGWLNLFLGAVLIVGLGVLRHFQGRRLRRSLRQVWHELSALRARPVRLSGALLTSMALTLCNASGFYYCIVAVGIPLSLVTVLLVFSLGILLGTLTPTPGGLGGLEAGLLGGLLAYHIPSSEALGAVLIYRLLSFWLMLIVGAVAFLFAERFDYI